MGLKMADVRCKACNGLCEDHSQPTKVNGQWEMIPSHTCMGIGQFGQECPMYRHTVNHIDVDLVKYGASQHPRWQPPAAKAS